MAEWVFEEGQKLGFSALPYHGSQVLSNLKNYLSLSLPDSLDTASFTDLIVKPIFRHVIDCDHHEVCDKWVLKSRICKREET